MCIDESMASKVELEAILFGKDGNFGMQKNWRVNRVV